MTELPEHLAKELPVLVTLGGSKVKFFDLLQIDPDNLPNEYIHHASWQGLLASEHSSRQLIANKMERKVKALRAMKYLYYKSHFESLYNFKPTEASLEAAIERDPEMVKAYETLIDAQNDEQVWFMARNTFLARKDMLAQLGAHDRTERKMSPTS